MSEGDAEVIEPGTAEGTQVMDIFSALKEVLKKALVHDGIARGLSECAKALDKRTAHLCVLAQNCDEPAYVRLVEALCAEHGINILKVLIVLLFFLNLLHSLLSILSAHHLFPLRYAMRIFFILHVSIIIY